MRRREQKEFREALAAADAQTALVVADSDLTGPALEYLARHPNARVVDLATALQCPPVRIRELVETPAFRALLAEVKEGVDPAAYTMDDVRAMSIRHVVDGMRKLNTMTDLMEAKDLIASVTMAARNIGIGTEKGPLVSVTVNDPRRLTDEELEQIVSVQAREVEQAPDGEDS